jgi:hypothetical protein
LFFRKQLRWEKIEKAYCQFRGEVWDFKISRKIIKF